MVVGPSGEGIRKLPLNEELDLKLHHRLELVVAQLPRVTTYQVAESQSSSRYLCLMQNHLQLDLMPKESSI